MSAMRVLVSDTSVPIDLERGLLLESALRLPFAFAVPDLLYERELKDYGVDCHGVLWLTDRILEHDPTAASDLCRGLVAIRDHP